ncbi:MAG: sterol carrier protein [Polyangiaceae bacterium UTPRO1]|jgi:acetyl-CoA acetyltransferase|nr:thiolase family protein [Myxococcales bacterium]OQY67700.1 MAG: sterol carrier protein [Polyangiaceae bacterium UTPRO1]
MALRGEIAIAGLGQTEQGKVYDRSHMGFAVAAVERALADAGLARTDLDGLLLNPGISWGNAAMGSFMLQQALGLRDLALQATMNLGGATAGAMIQYAALAIAAGMCSTVACVFSDRPLKSPEEQRTRAGKSEGSAASYAFARGLDAAYGQFGVNAMYALVARRHMHVYGTTQDHLGAVAVSERRWANRNPAAQLHAVPLSLADYHASRWVVEPFHVLDCCLVSNGGVAVIVTSAERARALRKPPVYVWGMGQGHPGGDPAETLVSGASLASKAAFAMAGIEARDVQVAELYDCYTFTVLVTLEDYGFCAKGEAGDFVAAGHTAPGGRLPVNTGGGQLSSSYMWGMTPLAEGVLQARGEAGDRQVPRHDVVLVSGNGGLLSTHTTLVLSPLPS